MKIGLVDDDPDIRVVLGIFVTTSGWDVQTASSAREAVTEFDWPNIDVVVTDWMMPGGSGADLMEWMALTQAHIPVLVLSAVSAHQIERDLAQRDSLEGLTYVVLEKSRSVEADTLEQQIRSMCPPETE